MHFLSGHLRNILKYCLCVKMSDKGLDHLNTEECENNNLAKQTLRELLYMQHLNGKNCDSTIEAHDGTQFAVHRSILAHSSPVFSECFQNHTDIKILDVNPRLLRCAIKYAYTQTPYFVKGSELNLLHVARTLKIFDFDDKCEEFVIQCLSSVNCVTYYMEARIHAYSTLQIAAYDFILKHFLKVENLQALDTELLCGFLKDDKLNVSDEKCLWEVILRWIDADESTRERDVIDLLSCVRLKYIDNYYISSIIGVHPFVRKSQREWRLLLSKNSLIELRECQKLITSNCTRPKRLRDFLYLMSNDANGTGTIFICNELNNTWRKLFIEWEPPARCNYGCVRSGDNLYILGGRDNYDCWHFNVKDRNWTQLIDMSCQRSQAGVTILNGIIYYIGGISRSSGRIVNTVEIYSVYFHLWNRVTPMLTPRAGPAVTTYKRKVYVFGGTNNFQVVEKSAECYDPATEQWVMLPPMHTPRHSPSCIAYRNCIYVIGGKNDHRYLRSVERFNVAEEVWYSVADMRNSRKDFSTVVSFIIQTNSIQISNLLLTKTLILNGKIFVVGGINLNGLVKEIEYYDEVFDTWRLYRRMSDIDQTTVAWVVEIP